jgi:PAS domain S-box-containing protein
MVTAGADEGSVRQETVDEPADTITIDPTEAPQVGARHEGSPSPDAEGPSADAPDGRAHSGDGPGPGPARLSDPADVPPAPGSRAIPVPDDLRPILEGIAAGVTVQDDAGTLLFVNEDAARLSGYRTPAEMLAADPAEMLRRLTLIDEDGTPFDPARFPGRRVLAGETTEPVLIGFRVADQPDERWSMLLARPATLSDGRVVAINTFHDVTSRVEIERRTRSSERETRHLAEERRRAAEIARMLADAALHLDEARDVDAVARAAANAAVPVLADWAVVDLIRPDGSLRRAGVAAREGRLLEMVGLLERHPAVLDPDRATRRSVAAGSPVVIRDMAAYWSADPKIDPALRRLLEDTGTREAVVQPLIARGESIGSIAFVCVGDRSFDDAGIVATAEIAGRVGLAIANVDSYEAEQRARRAAEALADRMERLQGVTRTLAGATALDDVATIVAEEARRGLDADAVAFALVDESAGRLDILAPDGSATIDVGGGGRTLDLAADHPRAEAVRTVRPVWLERTGPDAAGGGGGAVCAVPIVADDAPIGGLWLRFRDARALAPDDQRLLRAYADLAAGAVVRLRLGAVRQLLLAANEAERARLESVLRQMPLGVVLAAVPDGRYLYANEAARRLSPTPIEIGTAPRTVARGFRPDGSELGPDDWPLRRAMVGETVENEIVEIAYPDGTLRTYGLSAAPIPGPSGAIESAVITYADVTERIRAQERETFLARASEVLSSSLDYETTVRTVADLAVPAFADWCVVQIASEEGVPQRIAVAHRDPAKVELAVRLSAEYPPDPDAPTGAAAILRSGTPEFMAEIPPDLLDQAARDDRHREMIQALQLRSYISVPLIAAGRILGVLTLVGAESGRRFEPGDVAFAENLASRAAAAIENARLFREGVRFKRLLDATGDAILMLDPTGERIVYANRGAAEQLDRPVGELVGSAIAGHVTQPGADRLREATAELTSRSIDARTVTLDLRRPDGATVPVEVRLEHVAPDGAPDGAPAGILAIARDIRERIVAQERLRRLATAEHARAAELNAVIRAMGDGVVVCDPDGRILLANPAAEDTFPDVEETTYSDILDQLEDPDGLAPAIGVRGGPVELRVAAGEERWIELSTWPVAAGRDRATGHEDETIVLLRDVTEQRQRQAVRDTFIGVLSHELRTPVTTIYAGAKVLARPGDLSEATRADIFSDIVVESERLHRLVEDVVAMTRFGDEGGDVGSEPVLLQRVLPSVIASEKSRWPAVSFVADIAAGLPTVIADPTYVEQVVRNLLSNAAKYGGPGAEVTLRVDAPADEVVVRIFDNGPGFPPDDTERLFDLFFRSEGTARAAPGAGIGLFVCARLIRAMGGRIWAANRPGGGAEFGFALRIRGEDDSAQRVPRAAGRAFRAPGSPGPQTQRRQRAPPMITSAKAIMTPTTMKKLFASSKNGSLKFMPITPARTIPGRTMAEIRVSAFITSFVRCEARPR